MNRRPPRSTLFPSPTLFRSGGFLSRQRKRDNVPALAASSQMLQNVASFQFGQRVLGERRQHIRVGMIDRDRRSLQPFRSEEHTSELQSQSNLVCRLLLEKQK